MSPLTFKCKSDMEKKMYCGKCGAELPNNAKFCDKCGAAVSENADNLINEDKGQSNAGIKYTAKSHNGANTEKKKKWPVIAGIAAVVIIFLTFFGGGGMDPVETVKNGCLTQFSSTTTIGEAFDIRFENGEWSSTDSTIADNAYNVFFTGYEPVTQMDWKVAFYLEDVGDGTSTIEVDYISVGEDLENDPSMLYYIIDYIYTGNLDELYSDMGEALWGAIFSAY